MKKTTLWLVQTAPFFVCFFIPSFANANGLEGRWSLQDPRNTRTILEAAVDKAASDMNFAIRAFNQPFLNKERERQVCEIWRLRLIKDSFHWKCDDEKAQKMPTNANQLEVEENGIELEKTFKFSAKHISTSIKKDYVTRINTWRRISDIQLEYTYMVKSANLPKPLKWTLIYRRH
ncbi:lipase chaperone [Marinomonas agarivorans]|nr:lipase chaperone [Marinomonas agarivorans]